MRLEVALRQARRRRASLTRDRRVDIVFLLVGLALSIVLGAAPVFAQQAQPLPGQEGYVPLKNLPPTAAQETLPAAPLVVGAYAFVWAVLIVYLWSIWRRLGKVQAEIGDLQRRLGKRQATSSEGRMS